MLNKKILSMVYSLAVLLILEMFLCFHAVAMPPLETYEFPVIPDYSVSESWLTKPVIVTAPVDVFYVYPTVLFNDTDWVMDVTQPAMYEAAMTTVESQASVFKGQANIYAPMYRQMNISGLGLSEEDAKPLQEIVHNDVWRAFNYYLENENNGRPFFLAGHSQGSMILTDLMLKYWGSTGVEDRLVMALLLGWSLTADDLATNPAVQICESSDSTGCVITYNTMAGGRQGVAPTLKKGSLAVNPLSWTMGGEYIEATKNLGAVFFENNGISVRYPYFTSAQIVKGGLVVEPEDMELVTVAGGHFPAGIFHAFDYALFFENIKVNIAERIDAYTHHQ